MQNVSQSLNNIMKISKLKYADKETAIADLLDKNVYVMQTIDEEEILTFGEGISTLDSPVNGCSCPPLRK